MRTTNKILKEKNEVGGLILPDLKTYHKATVIKTVVLVGKNKEKNKEINGTE